MDIRKQKEVGLQYQNMIAKDVQKRMYFQIKMEQPKPITIKQKCTKCKTEGYDCFSTYRGKSYCKGCTLTSLPHSIFKVVKND